VSLHFILLIPQLQSQRNHQYKPQKKIHPKPSPQSQPQPQSLLNSEQSTHLQPKLPVPTNLEQNKQPQCHQQP